MGCGGDEPRRAAAPDRPGTTSCPAPPPCTACPTGDDPTASGAPDSPEARLVLAVWTHLAQGQPEEVSRLLEPELAAQLTPARLVDIVKKVERAHGAGRLVDVWATTLREDGETFSAGAGLLRMSRSKTRFRLLLVLNADQTIRGLWLKPI